MAGAGYKLFNTGDVLTAAQVNTYLMEQSVMVFNNAAARTTALSGVVAEGMISYLKDTNAVEVYDGANWVASDDPNAIQNSIVDAKGDLISATADNVPARLAVGNNGETLVADSSATTGLRWQGNYSAGKNAIINGDFRIWQRGTSFSNPNATYTADRFLIGNATAVPTSTASQQTFTPGTAPVAGYEGATFFRLAITSQGSSTAQQIITRLEDVRLFAGQQVTFSFWAKAASTITINDCKIGQNFGSGGSGAVETGVTLNSTSVGTSWARYTGTITMPSVSGKTIGSSSYVYVFLQLNSSNGNYTFDTWGWQVEAGSTATAFQTATGTLAGELAACQRYFYTTKNGTTSSFGDFGGVWFYAFDTGQAFGSFSFPVTMRVAPTVNLYGQTSGTAGSMNLIGSGDITGVTASIITPNSIPKIGKTSGWSAGNQLAGNCTASAEL